jgi:hypothetical protein
MKMEEIKAIAKGRGIVTGRLVKGELIRAIQRQEGNPDCFGDIDRVSCPETGCLWLADCQPR